MGSFAAREDPNRQMKWLIDSSGGAKRCQTLAIYMATCLIRGPYFLRRGIRYRFLGRGARCRRTGSPEIHRVFGELVDRRRRWAEAFRDRGWTWRVGWRLAWGI